MGELNPNATSVQMVKYTYQGNPVNFSIDGNVMVSATNMAKPFGNVKQPIHWLKNQQTKDFLAELSKLRILSLADLVQVKKGGINPGTWFHEDVALEFARWLSPSFAIWCNDRIKEILLSQVNGGMVPVIRQTPPAIDTTEKDREIAKWKSRFEGAMEIVKSMHESSKLIQEFMFSMMKGGTSW
jgi:hypothetical protein